VFDCWLTKHYPDIPFERYADYIICHCRGEEQARALREALAERLSQCRLALHPHKTRIVYCKDANREGNYPEQRFEFLGYAFRPRLSRNREGKLFVSFSPAVSDKAAKAMRQEMRRWRLHHRNDLGLEDLARWTRPMVMGWVRYYGRFHASALRGALHTLDDFLVRWARRKYKRLRAHKG
jgi:RNA-directed DNA polymerase